MGAIRLGAIRWPDIYNPITKKRFIWGTRSNGTAKEFIFQVGDQQIRGTFTTDDLVLLANDLLREATERKRRREKRHA